MWASPYDAAELLEQFRNAVVSLAEQQRTGLPDSARVLDILQLRKGTDLAALGGAGALMAQSVQTLEVIAWPDLGCEAVRRLTVKDMPLTVILDAHGGDLYQSGPAAYLETT